MFQLWKTVDFEGDYLAATFETLEGLKHYVQQQSDYLDAWTIIKNVAPDILDVMFDDNIVPKEEPKS